jgi:hypothetical protein
LGVLAGIFFIVVLAFVLVRGGKLTTHRQYLLHEHLISLLAEIGVLVQACCFVFVPS